MIDALPELPRRVRPHCRNEESRNTENGACWFRYLLIVACAAGVWFGMNYLKDPKKPVQPVGGEVSSAPATSGVAGEVKETLLGSGFTQVKILDGATAEDAIHSVKDQLGITDANTSFVMKSKTAVGNDTYYRFSQTCGGLKVYGGEVVLAAAQNGTPIALNGRVVETDGLDLNAALDAGGASNAVSEYVNKLSGDYRITEGANVTVAEKAVCNFEGKTYLAYVSNVSGYNERANMWRMTHLWTPTQAREFMFALRRAMKTAERKRRCRNGQRGGSRRRQQRAIVGCGICHDHVYSER
ncbi:MAG: hypothetical protein ACLVG9_00190 [Eubacteriales bacterium]